MDKWIVGTNSIFGTFAAKFGAGALAGVTAVTLTYPLDTIRARLAFQVTGEHKYTGIINAGTTIYRTVRKYRHYIVMLYLIVGLS
jgi:solute carrier family 25 protein 16